MKPKQKKSSALDEESIFRGLHEWSDKAGEIIGKLETGEMGLDEAEEIVKALKASLKAARARLNALRRYRPHK